MLSVINFIYVGLLEEEKTYVQSEMIRGSCRVVVATMALGIGIHQTSVNGVIHLNMPKSLEQYIQETGRCHRIHDNNDDSSRQQEHHEEPIKDLSDISIIQAADLGLCSLIHTDYDYRLMYQQEASNYPDKYGFYALKFTLTSWITKHFESLTNLKSLKQTQSFNTWVSKIGRRDWVVENHDSTKVLWILTSLDEVKRLTGLRNDEDVYVYLTLLSNSFKEDDNCSIDILKVGAPFLKVKSHTRSISDLMSENGQLKVFLKRAKVNSGIYTLNYFEVLSEFKGMSDLRTPNDIYHYLYDEFKDYNLHITLPKMNKLIGNVAIKIHIQNQLITKNNNETLGDTINTIISKNLNDTYLKLLKNWEVNVNRLNSCYHALRRGAECGADEMKKSINSYFNGGLTLDQENTTTTIDHEMGAFIPNTWPVRHSIHANRNAIEGSISGLVSSLAIFYAKEQPIIQEEKDDHEKKFNNSYQLLGYQNSIQEMMRLIAENRFILPITIVRILGQIQTDGLGYKNGHIRSWFGSYKEVPLYDILKMLYVNANIKDV